MSKTFRTVCTLCGNPPGAPRNYVYDARGRVVQGCVGAAHVGALRGEAARWINRREARTLRRALAHVAATREELTL
jgi:hypothetical protein